MAAEPACAAMRCAVPGTRRRPPGASGMPVDASAAPWICDGGGPMRTHALGARSPRGRQTVRYMPMDVGAVDRNPNFSYRKRVALGDERDVRARLGAPTLVASNPVASRIRRWLCTGGVPMRKRCEPRSASSRRWAFWRSPAYQRPVTMSGRPAAGLED